MPESASDISSTTVTPDYAGLIKFLVEPFLEMPESLRVDCEVSQSKSRLWVRLAFETSDKGRVFGRGGRNIQAVRTILEAAAKSVGYVAHLDVFGSTPSGRDGSFDPEDGGSEKPHPRRSPPQKPSRPRTN